MKNNDEAVDRLKELGLTDLEAGVYMLLLRKSPLSAYAVAKTLGRSVPNMYKTLSAMAQKGMVMSTLEGTTKMFVATSLEEYLEQYIKKSADLAIRTRETFQQLDLSSEQPKTAIYKLQNTEQVISKTTKLIENARVSITVSADRFPLLLLSAYLTEASKRGVNVLVNSYIPLEIPGCEVVHWQRRAERQAWPGQILVIVADGREVVTGFFSFEETVISALWVNNPYMSVVLHHGRSADTILASILNYLKNGRSMEELVEMIETMTEKHIFTIPHDYLYRSILSESDSDNSERKQKT